MRPFLVREVFSVIFNRKNFLFGVFIFSVFLTVSPVRAQKPTPTPADDVIKIDSRLVVVPVSVTDSAGMPVLNLKKEDFAIREEGKAQEIAEISNAEQVPLEIALLFDISASTDAMFQFEQETAAQFLREVMRPNDRASVFTIGAGSVMVMARNTAENAAAAITSIKPTQQPTAFHDSVSAAAEYLRTNAPKGSRRVIVVISDGEDTNSVRIARAIQDGYTKLGKNLNTLDSAALRQVTVVNRDAANLRERDRVLQTIQNADTVFYAVNPAGNSYQLNKISQTGQANLQRFAEETGGTAFLPKLQPIDSKNAFNNTANTRTNKEALTRLFHQLANELQAQYLVQYYSEAEYPANKYVKLDVALKTSNQYKLRARRGYFVKN
jgi:VWFA-related protein